MKTHEIVIPGLVGPEGIEVREREVRALEPGEALVEMEATGVSYAEVQMLRGRYPGQPAFPFVPGYDLIGRVLEVGPGVDAALVGKRVATLTETGAWAEHVVRPAEQLVVVPNVLDPAEVDTLIVNGVTALKMLHRTAQVRRGQTIVVLGAGGGVGTMLVQLARLAGVRVIGTCKPTQREAVVALGAEAVDYTRGAVLEAVRALVPEGVDVVFDHLGGDSVEQSFAMLRTGGAVVSYGQASIKVAKSPWTPILRTMWMALLWRLRPGGRRLKLFDLWGRGTFTSDSTFRPRRFWRDFREDLSHLMDLLSTGRIVAHVARRVPLLEAASALAEHHAGGFVGKIVLEGSSFRAPLGVLSHGAV